MESRLVFSPPHSYMCQCVKKRVKKTANVCVFFAYCLLLYIIYLQNMFFLNIVWKIVYICRVSTFENKMAPERSFKWACKPFLQSSSLLLVVACQHHMAWGAEAVTRGADGSAHVKLDMHSSQPALGLSLSETSIDNSLFVRQKTLPF